MPDRRRGRLRRPRLAVPGGGRARRASRRTSRPGWSRPFDAAVAVGGLPGLQRAEPAHPEEVSGEEVAAEWTELAERTSSSSRSTTSPSPSSDRRRHDTTHGLPTTTARSDSMTQARRTARRTVADVLGTTGDGVEDSPGAARRPVGGRGARRPAGAVGNLGSPWWSRALGGCGARAVAALGLGTPQQPAPGMWPFVVSVVLIVLGLSPAGPRPARRRRREVHPARRCWPPAGSPPSSGWCG